MDRKAILIAEGSDRFRESLRARLLRHGFDVITARDGPNAIRCFHAKRPSLVIAGPAGNGSPDPLHLTRRIREWDRHVPIILIPAASSEDLVIEALRSGVNDYLKASSADDAIEEAVHRCVGNHLRELRQPIAGRGMIGESLVIRDTKRKLLRLAKASCNVLITGETGSGKELAATLIHENSPRAHEPFIRINCAAIPDSLLESELFGHEKGAFTGADCSRDGMLKSAGRGTVLLDEVADLSTPCQAKILRAVDTKEIRLLGAKGSISLDVRFVSATNRNLEQFTANGGFRQDLYFRLNVTRVHMPPLRDRREDIPLLATHFLRRAEPFAGRALEGFTDEALGQLLRYDWPGNVRELKNFVEASILNGGGSRVSVSDFPERSRSPFDEIGGAPQDEKTRVLAALLSTRWNKSEAAQRLRCSRMTLYRKLAKYQIADMEIEPMSQSVTPRRYTSAEPAAP
jgi:DNA-binding NtrC family response regulator